jgi:hypothetical protein
MEMVTVLQRSSRVLSGTRITTSGGSARMWILMAADLATVLWMNAVGEWLDQTSRLTATATLGGHHVVVMGVAGAGFVMLALLALLTDGFTVFNRRLASATSLACVVSVVALAGVLTFVLVALLGRVVFGRLLP